MVARDWRKCFHPSKTIGTGREKKDRWSGPAASRGSRSDLTNSSERKTIGTYSAIENIGLVAQYMSDPGDLFGACINSWKG